MKANLWWAISGGFIGVIGVISNSLSVSYFILKERDKLAGKLFILLNSMDLSMCVSASVALLSTGLCGIYQTCFETPVTYTRFTFIFLSQIFVEATAFATVLLSVNRCIKLSRPFYRVNRKLLVFISVTFFSYLVVREGVSGALVWANAELYEKYSEIGDVMVIGSMLLMICIVFIVNVVSISCIIKSKVRYRRPAGVTYPTDNCKKDATITVIIISVIFLFFNILLIAGGFSQFYIVNCIAEFLSIPFNSVLNPLVYLLRKKEMRQHIRGMNILWRG